MNRCFYCGATGNLIDSEYPDSTGWGYPIKACKNQKECIAREKAIKMGEMKYGESECRPVK
jgi:hypothetical protein